MDTLRPASPADVRAFPGFASPSMAEDPSLIADVPPECVDEASRDNVVHIKPTVRAIGLYSDPCRVFRVHAPSTNGVMADTGANVDITPTESMLVGVRDIAQVKIGVALNGEGDDGAIAGYCTRMGYLPMARVDGTTHFQPFLVHPNASDHIMSPDSVMRTGRFARFTIEGFSDDSKPGEICFFDDEDRPALRLPLQKSNGLYYFPIDCYGVDSQPIKPSCSMALLNRIHAEERDCFDPSPLQDAINSWQTLRPSSAHPFDEIDDLPALSEERPFLPILDPFAEVPFDEARESTIYHARAPTKLQLRKGPTDPASQLESELWAARLGFCGEWQLDVIPASADGLPEQFNYHPFRFIDFKEAARIRKGAARRRAERVKGCGQRYYMDYGFMRASSSDFTSPKDDDDGRIVDSFDGFSSYLLIVDEHSRYIWVFLCQSKEPPIAECSAFLKTFGLPAGGTIRCDQGGELARSKEFVTAMQRDHQYSVEPTGADSPSQNGMVENKNRSLAILVRTLLYGAALHAKYWSAALLHAVWLLNRQVHSATKRTPFEGFYGKKPNLKQLKMFGARVCVRKTGKRRAKLDRQDFTGIFLGYSATDSNIRYIDLKSGLVKTSHHAVFDEAWYLQPSRPPAAQLLYDLGLANDDAFACPPASPETELASYPPLPAMALPLPKLPAKAMMCPFPLRLTEMPMSTPPSMTARAATLTSDPYLGTPLQSSNKDGTAVKDYCITRRDTAQIYVSPHAYHNSFDIDLPLRRYKRHDATAGMRFDLINGRLILSHIEKSTVAAKIPRWRSRLRGAWLRKIGDVVVTTIDDVRATLAQLATANATSCWLTFSHPEIAHGLTNDGIPQVNVDQLNPRHLFRDGPVRELNAPSPLSFPPPDVGPPAAAAAYLRAFDDGGVTNLVCRSHKLTRGKLLRGKHWSDWQRSEWTQLDQYEKQGMFGQPTKVAKDDGAIFNLVWMYVEKVLDKRKKARCTCDGSTRAGQVRVLDYTYANCIDQMSNRLFYALSAAENLVVYGADVSNAFGEAPPPKQGFYIRPDRAFHDWWVQHKGRDPISPGYVIPVIKAMQGHPEAPRLWEKHADGILRKLGFTPTTHEPCLYSGLIEGERVFLKRQVDDFEVAVSSERLANIIYDMIDEELTFPLKRMGLVSMFNGLDILQTRDYIKVYAKTYIERVAEKHLNSWMKLSHSPNCPTPLPTNETFLKTFHAADGARNDDGTPDVKAIASLEKHHGFGYRSGIGELIWPYVTRRPDIAYGVVRASQHSSCPAEIHFHAVKHALKYMVLTKDDGIYFWRPQPRDDLPAVAPPQISSTGIHGGERYGKTILAARSILYDLGIPREAATIAYEDNNACIAMANAQKPTSRTRHVDIRWFALADWVERNLIILERIATAQNMADHFTKQLGPTLFKRHVDYVMGQSVGSIRELAVRWYTDFLLGKRRAEVAQQNGFFAAFGIPFDETM
ncbi:hypothetical protein ACHAXT_003782 [Thalassiosira profunda]